MNKYYLENRNEIREYNAKRQANLLKENPTIYYKNLYERVKRWRVVNREKYIAHKKVFIEIRSGRLRAENCFCGKKGEAHHDDYSKPLEIIWLCRGHHLERGRNNRA